MAVYFSEGNPPYIQSLSYAGSTNVKIGICVLAFFVSGYACLFFFSNVNAVVAYTGWGIGGSLILGLVILNVVDYIYAKRTAAKNFERRQILQISQAWKSEFKSRVLSTLQAKQSPTTIHQDLTLSHEQLETLKIAVQRLNRYDWTAATIYAHKRIVVFSLPEIPDRIFKMQTKDDYCSANLTQRIKDTEEARRIIQQENLYLLHVPAQQVIQLEGCEILVEEKFEVLHSWHNQKSLYEFCQSDPDLKPFFYENVRQLIRLILKLGYSDVRYDNNPLLSNGQGFALFDLDSDHLLRSALVTGSAAGEQDGILSCLSTEMLDKLIPWLRQQLTQTQLETIRIDQIREARCQTEERNQQFAQFLQDKGIVTGKETVKLHSWQLRKTYESQEMGEVEKEINSCAEKNLGLQLLSERTFFVYKNPRSAQLNKLKQEGEIFDWFARDQGYYVLC